LHVHPALTLAPLLLAGHPTGRQLLKKYGDTVDAVTVPVNPALHVQPLATFSPTLLAGHATALHAPV
jgi:hypothetical protein